MQDNPQRERLEDLGWEQMRQILDREMPVRRRAAIIWPWAIAASLLIGFAGALAWYGSFSSNRYTQPTVDQSNEPIAERRAVTPDDLHLQPQDFTPSTSSGVLTDADKEKTKAAVQSKQLTAALTGAIARRPQGGTGQIRQQAAGDLSSENPTNASGVPTAVPQLEQATSLSSSMVQNQERENTDHQQQTHSAAPFAGNAEQPSSSDARQMLPAQDLPAIAMNGMPYAPNYPFEASPSAVKGASVWLLQAETGWIAQTGMDQVLGGAHAGMRASRGVLPRVRLSGGLSVEQFSSLVSDLPAAVAEANRGSQPTLGSATQPDPVEIGRYAIQSTAFFMPLGVEYGIGQKWRLETGLRAGWLPRHALARHTVNTTMKDSFTTSATSRPFQGQAGDRLNDQLFAPFTYQAYFGLGYAFHPKWSAQLSYRLGEDNWVKAKGVETQTEYWSVGLRYRLK